MISRAKHELITRFRINPIKKPNNIQSIMTLCLATMTSYSDNEDEWDQFEDAITDIEDEISDDICAEDGEMNLERAIQEGERAINYFFNNQFLEAKELMSKYCKSEMYHTLGNSVFLFLEAILTFEHSAIVTASKGLKQAINVCNKFRKRNTLGESIGKMVKKNNFNQYTEIEAHAELCHAECLLLKSMLTFMEDETLSSFIKAGLKIRSCYHSYKDCQQILIKSHWSKSSNKVHFESGVRMGIGAFNLMISLLPSRVIRLLEFIGFSGNKELGLEDLTTGYKTDGLRQILCLMTLLGYNLIVLYVVTHQEGDMEICEEILRSQMVKHPDGVWFLFFKGRLEFMKGNLDTAISWYKKSWQSQNLWPQFHHICFWELLWVYCVKADWKEALIYCNHLLEGSRWSRCIYSYQKAALMCMMKENLNATDLVVIDNLMKDVPKYKQRIAGKSLPLEKFAVKKSERYFKQNRNLVLPVVEMMYIWNLFKVMKNFHVATNIHKMLEKAMKDINSESKSTKWNTDNRVLVLLLQGACLRMMKSPLQALDCLETAISLQKELVEDHYLIPYAIVELALIEWEQGNKEKAILALEDAKKNYTGYSLESRLHFRIHTALSEFKNEMKITKSS